MKLIVRYSRTGEMKRTRLPSMNCRVTAPGFVSSSLNVSTNLPSHPVNSEKASPAISCTLGCGGTARCPHCAQNGPLIVAWQFKQAMVHGAGGSTLDAGGANSAERDVTLSGMLMGPS